MARARGSRGWVFTVFNSPEHPWELVCGSPSIRYLVAGDELTKQTPPRQHWQGYVEYHSAKTLKASQETLQAPDSHHQCRKGTPKEAADYCRKGGKFYEHGQCLAQGRRNDLHDVRDCIKRGGNMSMVCDLATSYQGLCAARLYRQYCSPPRGTVPTVTWRHGPTGTGKTRDAIAAFGDKPYYTAHGDIQWFDGYDGQRCMLLDDVRLFSNRYSTWLGLLDRYEYRLWYKGGSCPSYVDQFEVTSPFSPVGFCEGHLAEGDSAAQLQRRITTVVDYNGPLHAWVAGH